MFRFILRKRDRPESFLFICVERISWIWCCLDYDGVGKDNGRMPAWYWIDQNIFQLKVSALKCRSENVAFTTSSYSSLTRGCPHLDLFFQSSLIKKNECYFIKWQTVSLFVLVTALTQYNFLCGTTKISLFKIKHYVWLRQHVVILLTAFIASSSIERAETK